MTTSDPEALLACLLSGQMSAAQAVAHMAAGEMLRPDFQPAYGPNMETAMTERPVIVTTEFRGVFFGYAAETSGENITLSRARNCIYWPSSQGGFGGLASDGPVKGARIGAVVDRIDLRKVTAVLEVTPGAAAAWEAANVYRG